MVLNYGRALHYFPTNIFSLNDAEFKAQLQAPHAYGQYFSKQNTCPTFTSYTTVTVAQPSGGGRRGGLGFGGFGGGFSGFGQHGNLGGSALAAMATSSTHVSAADFSVSNRGGNLNLGGSMTLSSMLGSTTMEFGTSHGAQGSSTTLHSIFTPPSMHQAAAMIGNLGVDPVQLPPQMNPLLMLHGFNAQGIQLLSQPRSTHATMAAELAIAIGKAAYFGSRVEAVIKVGQLAKETLEEGKQKLQDEQKKSGATSATGGPDDEDPEGDGKWQREPQSLQDEMALQEAKNGNIEDHEKIFDTLNDPKFKDMEKWQVKVKSANGKDSVVHYVRDPKTGARMDFKFKKSSID
jgi:hypothetical protein